MWRYCTISPWQFFYKMLEEKQFMSYENYITQVEEEFNAANLLVDKNFYREAISRAYHSMFHAA